MPSIDCYLADYKPVDLQQQRLPLTVGANTTNIQFYTQPS